MAAPPRAAAALEAPSTFESQGWHFEADVRPLTRSDIIDDLAKDERLCKVPDMYCGGAALRLHHRSSATLLELDGLEALLCSRWQPLPETSQLPSISLLRTRGKVPAADIPEEQPAGPFLGPVRCQFAAQWRPNSENPDVKELDVVSDWTCSSPYWGSTLKLETSEAGRREHIPADVWEETQEELPLELLKRRDDILWYQEVLFWEDELADNGLVRSSVRVRVMPTFWFVLLLCELRVDGVLLREVATRLFCEFDSDSVLREWTWKEATYEELRSRGINTADNPQISHANIGTTLLGDKDIQLRLRHRLSLSKLRAG